MVLFSSVLILAELMQQITGDYFYLSSNQYSVKQLNDAKATNFVGRLGSGSAVGASENQGVILLVAHLDAFGVAPACPSEPTRMLPGGGCS